MNRASLCVVSLDLVQAGGLHRRLPSAKETVMSRFPRVFLLALALILATAFPVGAENDAPRVKVATTTSLYDTGLWDVLETAFEAASGLRTRRHLRRHRTRPGMGSRRRRRRRGDPQPDPGGGVPRRRQRPGAGSVRVQLLPDRRAREAIRPASAATRPRRPSACCTSRRRRSSSRAATTPAPTPARRRSGRPPGSIPRRSATPDRGTSRPASAWAPPCRWPRSSAPTR